MKKWVFLGVGLLSAGILRAEVQTADAPPKAPAAPPTLMSLKATPQDVAWDSLEDQTKRVQAMGKAAVEVNPQPVKDLLAAAHDFAAKYPNDPRALNAVMLWAQVGDVMAQQKVAGGPSGEEIDVQFDKLVADKSLPREQRAKLRAMQLDRAMRVTTKAPGDPSAQWAAIEERFDGFALQFGADFSFDGKVPVLLLLRNEQVNILATGGDHVRYEALLQKLEKDPVPQIAAMAKQQLAMDKKMAELKTKPLDLKFTSVDGKEVDLAKLRGKVVLIDFWATWCGPCVQEVPEVVETYQKYHDKGFEIIGISLDQNLNALKDFTAKNNMTWPQYFDGKGWGNEISRGYGIDSIPAMWLVDKKGMLATTDGGEDLPGQVEKLLAAP